MTSPRAWQRMLSSRRLNLLDPSPLDIEIDDIAHGLARVARWNGQTLGEHAFSVAQHSLIVEYIFSVLYPKANPQDNLYALLHDAPEYVIGDMISPFKAMIGEHYKQVESRLEAAIHVSFGLPPDINDGLKKRIKKCDLICAYFEAVELAGFTIEEAEKYFLHPSETIKEAMKRFLPLKGDPTHIAQKNFLMRFEKLYLEVNPI